MKKALLVSLLVFPVGCAPGEIAGGGSPTTGTAGSSGLTGNASGTAGSGDLTGTAGSTGASGTVGGPGSGTAGVGSSAGSTGAGGTTGGAACSASGIPADVAAVIGTTCIACHGSPPIQGVPSSLATYASLTAPSKIDPMKSVATVALARMQSATMPMPPAPLSRATASQVAAFQAWVSAGTPPATCADGGVPTGGDAGAIADPYGTPVVCTSKTTWTGGNNGSRNMDPGKACISCHATSGDAPKFALAGTIYPTAHEPDLCNGGTTTTGAQVVVTGADGKSVTMTPNMAGNFDYQGALATPYTVKVTYMGRERAMVAKQTSGDCNGCHTQSGVMMAPGRIMLP